MAIDGEPSQTGDEGRNDDAAAPGFIYEDTGGMLGVHVVTDPDPSRAAQRIAAAGDVDLVADREHAESAFAARAEAGRTAVAVIGDRERAELEAAAAIGPERAGATPEAIAAIRQLADELRRIERIRQRTEDRFNEGLSDRLAAGSGLALHSDTLRSAAQIVVDIDAEIERQERELRALDAPVESAPREVDSGAGDEPVAIGRSSNRVAALSIAVVALAAAAGLLVADVPAIAAVVAVVGVIPAILLGRRTRHDEPELVSVRAAPVAPSHTPQEERARLVAHDRLETGLERAHERRRAAQRHWESLAGPDADPHDIDGVLRLRDPQFVVSGAAARSSPTIRTVSAVHRRALARWKVAWAAVGYDEPPAPDRWEEALRGLAERPSIDPDEARTRLAAADAWTAAGATIDRTLVLVEPDEWLPADDLARLMATLPAGAEVIVVQRGE